MNSRFNESPVWKNKVESNRGKTSWYQPPDSSLPNKHKCMCTRHIPHTQCSVIIITFVCFMLRSNWMILPAPFFFLLICNFSGCILLCIIELSHDQMRTHSTIHWLNISVCPPTLTSDDSIPLHGVSRWDFWKVKRSWSGTVPECNKNSDVRTKQKLYRHLVLGLPGLKKVKKKSTAYTMVSMLLDYLTQTETVPTHPCCFFFLKLQSHSLQIDKNSC